MGAIHRHERHQRHNFAKTLMMAKVFSVTIGVTVSDELRDAGRVRSSPRKTAPQRAFCDASDDDDNDDDEIQPDSVDDASFWSD
jgi:hypothetical protein